MTNRVLQPRHPPFSLVPVPSAPVPQSRATLYVTLLHIIFHCSQQGCARITRQGVRWDIVSAPGFDGRPLGDRASKEKLMAIQISKVLCRRLGSRME